MKGEKVMPKFRVAKPHEKVVEIIQNKNEGRVPEKMLVMEGGLNSSVVVIDRNWLSQEESNEFMEQHFGTDFTPYFAGKAI